MGSHINDTQTNGLIDVQSGSGTSNGATGAITVNFARPFASTPIVFVDELDPTNKDYFIGGITVSVTGFTATSRQISLANSATHTHTVTVTGGTAPTPIGLNAGNNALVKLAAIDGSFTSNAGGAHTHTIGAATATGINFKWIAILTA